MTATASKCTLQVVQQRLALLNPVIIGISPNRPNIFFSIKPYLKLDEFSEQLSVELRLQNISTPKSVIFCQSFVDCYQLYSAIKKKLKESFTYPSGYPDLQQFRLVEMYHGGCMTYVRENILNNFTKVGSIVRVVIATSSFGMGIDCSDIHRIIHWGTPQDIEQYVQETGRAGRDDESSEAMLQPKTRHTISETMKHYCINNTICRRKMLFKDFLFYTEGYQNLCTCCDICFRFCKCLSCSKNGK